MDVTRGCRRRPRWYRPRHTMAWWHRHPMACEVLTLGGCYAAVLLTTYVTVNLLLAGPP